MENIISWEKQAIKAALKGAWDQAIELNQKILKKKPRHIPALNRLAQAFWKKGDLARAKKTYQNVLLVDKFNLIAQKNLQRLSDPKKPLFSSGGLKNTAFLEEPGRTKIARALRLASSVILSQLNTGDEIKLEPKKHSISLTTFEGTYLGCLPDDLSHRLIHFLKGGNQYQTLVKAVDRQSLEVFIREIKRTAEFANQPSFISPSSLANSFHQE